ncbi:MAG: flagella basal body P-ring formation protein FlgA [Allosphingosinicella sp.]|uniref:flagella basal body P-ring formation protein FlgA n=1 Tax=Allosphingosinicella sp. TaxID=2823234 RepID=UPI003934350F
MMPIFRRLAALPLLTVPLLTAAPAGAQTFEDVGRLEARVAAALGAGIGEPGGPAAPIDRRLRLAACPSPATIDAPAMGAVAVRCEALGWRIRVPLVRGAGNQAPARAQGQLQVARAEPLIRRGDQVEVVALAAGFSVSTSGIADQDGAPGDRIRVRTEQRRGTPMIGEVLPDGRVALPGFN